MAAKRELLNLSFTLHDRTTRATGSTMRESFRLERATIRSDSTPAARPWPVIRRKSDSTMRAALIYVVGSIAVFYLFYLFLH
jgi:hypothetical protein